MTRGFTAVLAALVPLLAQAQHSPYGGEERREIKALSADEVTQYLAGAGMGYARAAELNRFPGPMHVLDLSDQLALSAEQRESARRLMERHKAEARFIGAKLVEASDTINCAVTRRAGTVLGPTIQGMDAETAGELPVDDRCGAPASRA
jgi:hypothetical protein